MEDAISNSRVSAEHWSEDKSTHLEIYQKYGRYNIFDEFESPEGPPGPLFHNPELDSLHEAIEEDCDDLPSSLSEVSDDSDKDNDDAIDTANYGKDAEDANPGPFIDPLKLPHNLNNFCSLQSFFYSPQYGGVKAEAGLKLEEQTLLGLKEQRNRIKAELQESRQRLRIRRLEVYHFNLEFKKLQGALGIYDELWREYQAFCESLEPRFGSRDGWSVTCFSSHCDDYVGWDPHLTLFRESAEMSLTKCNFRCEASREIQRVLQLPQAMREALEYSGPLCVEYEYVVHFWPIAPPTPRTGTEQTWGEQYPNLYRLANKALHDVTNTNVGPASELLKSLPDPKASFSGGWLFDYCREPRGREEPVAARQWRYRGAHKIDAAEDVFDADEESPNVVSSDESPNVVSSDVDPGGCWALESEAEDLDDDSKEARGDASTTMCIPRFEEDMPMDVEMDVDRDFDADVDTE